MNEKQWRSELDDVLSWSQLQHLTDGENCHDVHEDYANFYFSLIHQLGEPEQEFKVSLKIDDTFDGGDTLIHFSIYHKKHEDWHILNSDEYFMPNWCL